MKTSVFVVGAVTAVVGAGVLVWTFKRRGGNVTHNGLRNEKEVYAVFKADGSGWPADQVNRVAAEYDGKVATGEQLIKAKNAGAEWCVPTWVEEESDTAFTTGANYVAAWPISSEQVPKNCNELSSPNMVNVVKSVAGTAGVAVYGIKPLTAKPGHKILPFNTTTGDWFQE